MHQDDGTWAEGVKIGPYLPIVVEVRRVASLSEAR